MKFSRWLAILWFGAIIGTWILRGLPWNLDEYDQAKQAYTSYEMVGREAWWFQHTPRQGSATKPPLMGWMSAGIYGVTRSWDVAWRLPSLLAATGILTLLWKSGRKVSGLWGAWLATAAFAWNLLSIRLATMVRTDMVLAFFIFASGWLIWRRLQAEERWTGPDTATLTLLLAAATMTKGPIYHAFLLPGLLVWMIFAGAQENKKRIALGYFLASVFSLLPFLLWTGWRIQGDPAFYDQVVVKEFLGRFTTGEKAVHNNQTWYFYLPHLLTKFAPWSLLLIAVFACKDVRLAIRRNAAALWLGCWFLGGLAAMSLVPSKRVDRIFPVVPVAALCLATCLPILQRKRWGQPRSLIALGTLAVLGYGGYTGALAWNGFREKRGSLVKFGRDVRNRAAQGRWEYLIVEGRDEGLLMYAGKLAFSDVKTAAAALKSGSVQAAIVDSRNLRKLRDKTGPLETILEVAHPSDRDYSYSLVRLASPPPIPSPAS